MLKIFIVRPVTEKAFADPTPGPKERRANHSCSLRKPWSPVEGWAAGRSARRLKEHADQVVVCPCRVLLFPRTLQQGPPGEEGAAFFTFQTVGAIPSNNVTAGKRNVRTCWVPGRRRRLDIHGGQGQRSHAVPPTSATGLKLRVPGVDQDTPRQCK